MATTTPQWSTTSWRRWASVTSTPRPWWEACRGENPLVSSGQLQLHRLVTKGWEICASALLKKKKKKSLNENVFISWSIDFVFTLCAIKVQWEKTNRPSVNVSLINLNHLLGFRLWIFLQSDLKVTCVQLCLTLSSWQQRVSKGGFCRRHPKKTVCVLGLEVVTANTRLFFVFAFLNHLNVPVWMNQR